MNAEIACKLKNSFAINSKSELYSWGSYESGLLGSEDLTDAQTPTKVEMNAYGEEYLVNSISLGHFHSSAICNLKDYTPLTINFNVEEKKLIESFKVWFNCSFIWEIHDVKSFVQTFLKLDSYFTNLKFKKFKNNLLITFINYMKLKNKDSFNMKSFYETNLKIAMEIAGDDTEISIEKWEMLFPLDTKKAIISRELKNLQEFKEFISDCQAHFKSNQTDIPFFIRLVTNFKRNITKDDLYKILKYSEVKGSKKLTKEKKEYFKRIAENIFDDIYNSLRHKIDQKSLQQKKQEIPVIYILDVFSDFNNGDGILFTWGVNIDGRLGFKNKNSEEKEKENEDEFNNKTSTKEKDKEYIMDSDVIQNIPTIVKFQGNISIKKVACGYNHTLALGNDKMVYSWGNGKYGCLGNSNTEANFLPRVIFHDNEKNSFKNIKLIGAGMYYSVATDGKNIYSWGCGNSGRLGHGDEYSLNFPKKIKFFEDKDLSIKYFSCGDTHMIAIDNDDIIFSWGSGTYGKLGHGNNNDYNLPKKIEHLRNSKIDIVACGSNDSIVVTSDLKIFVFGKNTGGFLGTSLPPDKNIIVPTQMNILIEDPKLGINEVSMGSIHLLIKFSNGDLFTIGSYLNGVSGIPERKERVKKPTKIPNLHCKVDGENENDYKHLIKGFESGFKISSKTTNSKILIKFLYLACSQDNTVFLLHNGDVFMSGKQSLIYGNEIDVFNLEKNSGENTPTPNSDVKTPGTNKDFENRDNKLIKRIPFDKKVSFIAIAKNHVIFVSEFRAYSWGNNDKGVLGIGDRKGEIRKPTLIEKLPNNISMVACSDTHTMVLTMNGEIYAFGLNTYGKLGIGSINKYMDYIVNENEEGLNNIDLPIEYEPQLVKDISFAYFIVCGNNHSGCIMKCLNENLDTNNLYLWGSGYDGKLGDGTLQDHHIPNLSGRDNYNFLQASLGDEFTLALDCDGYLYGAGKSEFLGEKNNAIKKSTLEKIHNEKKYKFISSSSNFSVVVDTEGKMYGFGKIFKEKLEFIKEKEEIQSVDRMKFIACGQNHFATISNNGNDIYTWGSNSFFKCGQDLNLEKGGGGNRFFSVPKKIKKINFEISSGPVTEEDILDQIHYINMEEKEDAISEKSNEDGNSFEENDETNEKTLEEKNEKKSEFNEKLNEESLRKSHNLRRLNIQGKLLEEKANNKTEGIMEEDMRIISSFYKLSNNLFTNLRNRDNVKKRKMLETENKILKFINTGRDFKIREKYESEVPNIISLNFQIFEVFLNIVQKHPCYLADLLKKMSNKKNMEYIIKLVYGRNKLFLRSTRIISLKTGLWNNMFSSEKYFDKNSDDDTSYKIYKMILKYSSNNYQIIREIIADVILLFINELLLIYEKKSSDQNSEMNIKDMYKKIYQTNTKYLIITKAVECICKKIPIYFGSFSNVKNPNREKSFIYYNKNILWIYRCLILREYSKHNNKGNKENDAFFDYDHKIYNEFIMSNINQTEPRIKKYFNNYLFSPFVELLKDMLIFNSDADTLETELLQNQIISTLENMKKKYIKIYNLYKLDKTNFKKYYLNDILNPDTFILKDIYNIFLELSNSSFEKNSDEYSNYLEKMNDEFSSNLKHFKFDLTLDCVRENIKTAIEKGNERIQVPLTCEELIFLQSNFSNYSKQKFLDKKDPLKNILEIMSDFKIAELDNISTIRNFVFNFTLKPLTYIFDYNEDELILRCEKCLIPLNQKFFGDVNLENIIYGEDWKCNANYQDNDDDEEEDQDSLCDNHKKTQVFCDNRNRYKQKDDILNKHNLFKKFYQLNKDEAVLFYEDILYLLPRINNADDFLNVLEKEKENSMKNKDTEWRAEKIDKFLSMIVKRQTNHKNDKEKLQKINDLNEDLEKYLEYRKLHLDYVKEIKELIEFLENSVETVKSKMVYFENDTDEYSRFVEKGYCNEFFKEKGEKNNLIRIYENKMKNQKNNFKNYKFNMNYLFTQKIVNDMVQDPNGPASKNSVIFMQKSFLIFYKKENGYNVKLYYKDTNRKFILCGVETKEFMIDEFSLENELIYELRKNSKMNPSFTIGDMRFNVFYLMRLINSFENLNN